MQRLTAAAFVAFGSANANTLHQNIDLFTPKNFLNMPAGFLVKNAIKGYNSENGTGDVTYSQCDDDANIFTFDGDSTSNTPNPVVKGSHVDFNLFGIVSDSMEVTNLHVHVDWNGATLYDEDHEQDNKYDSNYQFSLGWDVPSYAPSGHYDVHITGTGNAAGVSGGKVLCVEAQMDL